MLPSLLVALAASPDASAYPWMIAHGYTSCAGCHLDPSGGGALTAYGRSTGQLLLSPNGAEDSGDPGKRADFLLGLVELPKGLTLQADFRGLGFPKPTEQADGSLTWGARAILMQSDLRAGVNVGKAVAYASAGVVSEGGQAAHLSSTDDGRWNAVSREYWAGYAPIKGLLVRAGRMELPFGLRIEEHTAYVRTSTRTNLNADQQAGVAASYGTRRYRAEVMGILGNPQVAPADYREQGYSAMAAWSPVKTLEVGASSLVTKANKDIGTLAPRTRQAHGVFGRYGGVPHTAIMAEGDLLRSDDDGVSTSGIAAMVLADVEVTPGLHLRGIEQWCDTDLADAVTGATTEWLSAIWFFAPRMDLRIDALNGTLRCGDAADKQMMALGQFHVYL